MSTAGAAASGFALRRDLSPVRLRTAPPTPPLLATVALPSPQLDADGRDYRIVPPEDNAPRTC
ncbi:MAG TPA: hypothetical protein VGB87_07595 [Vicinamibacteria bacterium]